MLKQVFEQKRIKRRSLNKVLNFSKLLKSLNSGQISEALSSKSDNEIIIDTAVKYYMHLILDVATEGTDTFFDCQTLITAGLYFYRGNATSKLCKSGPTCAW